MTDSTNTINTIQQSSHNISSYTIAWITARPELADILLDERHNEPEDLIREKSITDSFIWGRMGHHNIIIATSDDRLQRLPSIRTVLSVGTGAGVPQAGILLGDVVVSIDSAESCQQHSTHTPLLHALAAYKSKHTFLPAAAMNGIKTNFPGSEYDRLRADARTNSYGPRFTPAIHHGTIISGDTRVSITELQQFHNVGLYPLCFDEKSLTIPHVSIRGICQYIDEDHDMWQDYAAQTAAAFTKELLKIDAEPCKSLQTYLPAVHLTMRVEPYAEFGMVEQLLNADEEATRDGRVDAHTLSFKATFGHLMEYLRTWIYTARPSKRIYWATGTSGNIKQAGSVVEQFLGNIDFLGGSFFFRSSHTDAKSFFRSIVIRMLETNWDVIRGVLDVLEADTLLCDRSLQEQFDKLLVQPFSTGEDSNRKKVIVIDALDECESIEDTAMMLRLLSQTSRLGSVQLWVFITSGPDLPVQLGFQDTNGYVHDDVKLVEVV